MTRFLVKRFGECCWSTATTAHVTGNPLTVFLLRRLRLCRQSKITTIYSGCLTLAWTCAVTTPLHYLYELDSQHSRVNKDVTAGSCRINCLHFTNDVVLLACSQEALECALDGFTAACDQVGMKISSEETV